MKDKLYPGSRAITDKVEVKVYPTYVPPEKLDVDIIEKLSPHSNIFVYRIEITNHREVWVRLETRYWKVIDADGDEKVISGKGVVGETPKLYSGETFVYSSFCPLEKEWGTMEGNYGMVDELGNYIKVEVKRFYLIKKENFQINFVRNSKDEKN